MYKNKIHMYTNDVENVDYIIKTDAVILITKYPWALTTTILLYDGIIDDNHLSAKYRRIIRE